MAISFPFLWRAKFHPFSLKCWVPSLFSEGWVSVNIYLKLKEHLKILKPPAAPLLEQIYPTTQLLASLILMWQSLKDGFIAHDCTLWTDAGYRVVTVVSEENHLACAFSDPFNGKVNFYRFFVMLKVQSHRYWIFFSVYEIKAVLPVGPLIVCLFYFFFIIYSWKVQIKYIADFEAPREEPREAHGYLALGCDCYPGASLVNVVR